MIKKSILLCFWILSCGTVVGDMFDEEIVKVKEAEKNGSMKSYVENAIERQDNESIYVLLRHQNVHYRWSCLKALREANWDKKVLAKTLISYLNDDTLWGLQFKHFDSSLPYKEAKTYTRLIVNESFPNVKFDDPENESQRKNVSKYLRGFLDKKDSKNIEGNRKNFGEKRTFRSDDGTPKERGIAKNGLSQEEPNNQFLVKVKTSSYWGLIVFGVAFIGVVFWCLRRKSF